MGDMTGMVAIVTGGGKAKSIGYGIAAEFARAGADLVVVGHNHGKLEEARELERFGTRVLPVQCDGADDALVRDVVRDVVDALGHVDVLVNTMQAAKAGILPELKDSDFELAFRTGFYPALNFMRACYPFLKESRGSIINFGYRGDEAVLAGQGCLAAAKGAVEALSHVAAAEWARDGIRVICLSELVETGQLERLAQQYPEAYTAFAQQVGPLLSIEELGQRCVRLVTD